MAKGMTKREIEREYLFQSLCEDFKKLQAENDDLRKRLEQEPCEYAISREDALDILEDYDYDRDKHKENAFADARARMVALPSVTPIRPKGVWETGYTYPDGEYWKCSECGELIKVKFPMNFCNSCGADMRTREVNNGIQV